jgi:hypothetical protein
MASHSFGALLRLSDVGATSTLRSAKAATLVRRTAIVVAFAKAIIVGHDPVWL